MFWVVVGIIGACVCSWLWGYSYAKAKEARKRKNSLFSPSRMRYPGGIEFLLLLAGLAVFANSGQAAEVTASWDNNSGQVWEKVRIYRVLSPGNYALLKEVDAIPGTHQEVKFTLQPGSYVCVARAFMSGVEGPDSNQASKDVFPDGPQNFKFLAVIDVRPDGSYVVRMLTVDEIRVLLQRG